MDCEKIEVGAGAAVAVVPKLPKIDGCAGAEGWAWDGCVWVVELLKNDFLFAACSVLPSDPTLANKPPVEEEEEG